MKSSEQERGLGARIGIGDWDVRSGFRWPIAIPNFDLTTARRDVHCPVLVVHGRQDPIPLQSSAAVVDALTAGRVVLDDCGHVSYVEQPATLFRAVRDFLDRTSPTPA